MKDCKVGSAEWRHLVLLNYKVERSVIEGRLPRGVELDLFEGHPYVSLVGFLFQKFKTFGFTFPYPQSFAQVALRTYVKRQTREGWRRGVFFLREIIPGKTHAAFTKCLLDTNSRHLPTEHSIHFEPGTPVSKGVVEYEWSRLGQRNSMRVRTRDIPGPLMSGYLEHFIGDRAWGYFRTIGGMTLEIKVEHPPWYFWEIEESEVRIDVAGEFGQEFAGVITDRPESAYLMKGSKVSFYLPRVIGG